MKVYNLKFVLSDKVCGKKCIEVGNFETVLDAEIVKSAYFVQSNFGGPRVLETKIEQKNCTEKTKAFSTLNDFLKVNPDFNNAVKLVSLDYEL